MSAKPQVTKQTTDVAAGPASHIGRDSGTVIGKPVEVKPYNQLRTKLGDFTTSNPPRGFSVELSPDPSPLDSVVTKVVRVGEAEAYELMLHLANYGNIPVTATVRQL